MCPVCMATAGLIVGSVVSTGGLAAVVVKILRKEKPKTSNELSTNEDFTRKEQ